MAQAPTKIEAVQVQPGVPSLVEPEKQIIGAVASEGKIFVVTAVYDQPKPVQPAPPPVAAATPEARGPRRKE